MADPGLTIVAEAPDLIADRGSVARFKFVVTRIGGYAGPVALKEMLITNPYFQTFSFGADYMDVDTSKWPEGGYHLEVMAYDGNEPVAPQ